MRSLQDAPVASQSSSIKVAVKGSGKAVDVSVTVGEQCMGPQPCSEQRATPCGCMCTLITNEQQAMHGLGGACLELGP